MTRPTNVPRWADVSGEIVEPSTGKKDKGWVVAEAPPAQYMNWLANLAYQWIAWLDAITTSVRVTRDLSSGYGDAGGPWTLFGSTPQKISATTNSAAGWWVPLDVPIGAKINAVRARLKSGGATSYIEQRTFVFAPDGTTVASSTGVFSDQTGGTAWQDVAETDPLSGHIVAAGERVLVAIIAQGAGGATRTASAVEVEWEYP